MSVNIIIDNRTNRRPCGFDVDKMILKELNHCDPEHLVGLDKIIILNSFSGNKSDCRAYYSPRYGQSKPSIFLSFSDIFWGNKKWPFCFRFVVRYKLAGTLYHEIGHHYHYTLKHGVKKSKAEDFADQYRLKMMRKTAPKWTRILYPIHLIIMLVNKIHTSRN